MPLKSASILVASTLFASLPACAQSAPLPPLLVTWAAPGALALPSAPAWHFQKLTIYDNGNRPVALYNNPQTNVFASFILFKNLSGKPTSEGCRADSIEPLAKHFANAISERKDASIVGADGRSYASTTYLFKTGSEPSQRNVFAFAGDKDICTEIHLSTVTQGPAGEVNLQLALEQFHPRLGYIPSAQDLVAMATYLFPTSPGQAAPYYGESLPRLTAGPQQLTQRRIITDQLVMALGMSGHLDAARHFATDAIEQDPDYPLNYYNLACADAEQGNASAARTHLEQAFARKANALPGESLPDPTKDDSLQKLKSNKPFWDYVQTLSK